MVVEGLFFFCNGGPPFLKLILNFNVDTFF